MLPRKGKESSRNEGRIFWVTRMVKQMTRENFREDSSKWKEIGIDGEFLK